MDKLREAVGKARRRPVADGLWDYLADEGKVGDAETKGSLDEQVEYLLGCIDAIQEARDSDKGTPVVLDRPRDTLIRARADALSAIYAAWAAQDQGVDMFRRRALMRRDADAVRAWRTGGPHPGYLLLREQEVPAWVLDRHNAAAPDGDGDAYIQGLLHRQRSLIPEVTALLRELRPEINELLAHGQLILDGHGIVNLNYVDHGQPRILTVLKRSTLGDLAELGEKLSDRYCWHPAWAANFVITGEAPIVSTYSASAQVSYGMESAAATRVSLTLDPFLPPQQVGDLFAGLRGRLQPQPPRRAQTLRSYRLAEHVGPHIHGYPANPAQVRRRGRPRTPGPGGFAYYLEPADCTWQELRRSWNSQYPDGGEDGKRWIYDRLDTFTHHSQNALIRLLDPNWGLKALREQGRQNGDTETVLTELMSSSGDI